MGSWNKGAFFFCISCALLVATALHSEVETGKNPDLASQQQQQINAQDHAQGKNQFVIIDGKDYYVGLDVYLSWVEAVRLCASFNMRLISLQTMEKFNTFQNYLNTTAAHDQCFWTSGIRTEGMNYMWSSLGEEFAPNAPWRIDNPALANSTENCVCLWGGGVAEKLADRLCTDNHLYVCEYPCLD